MVIADLHIHSRYSRATSRDAVPELLELWARRKGIGLVGTGDFTHPAWRAELAEKLVPNGEGFYTLREGLRRPSGVTGDQQVPHFVISGTFEGRRRANNAAEGIDELKKYVDSLIIVSNDNLLEVIGRKPIEEAFQAADNVLRQGVQTISDLIAVPALINLDFADVRSVMQNQGRALIGIGMAEGEDKAVVAAEKAIQSPLLEANISGAKSAIINITGGDKVSLYDAQNAVAVIQDAAGGDVDCIFGIAINEQLGDAVIVTVIATGFEEQTQKTRKKRSENPQVQLAQSSQALFTQPAIQTPVNPGVVTTAVEETNQDDQIPNFFFNR